MRVIAKDKMSKTGKMSKMLSWICVAGMLFMTACGSTGTQQTEQMSADRETQTSVESQQETEQKASAESETVVTQEPNPTKIRVGSLKGPTTMGIVNLMKKAENGMNRPRVSYMAGV